jgi:hypothetical protein
VVLFHFVWVNDQIASREFFAPVRFFTPFPRQSSRPCGTPRVYRISRPDIPQPYPDTPDVYYRAHTVLGPDSVGFPRGKHRCGETMFGGSKGVCPFGRRTLYGVREGEEGSCKRSEASVERGKAELFPLQGDSGRLNLPMSLHPSLNTLLNCLS